MYILIVTTIIILLLFIWICNKKYKNSNYFLDDYNKIKKFVDGVPKNLEIVNTGSNHAYYGFNYDNKKYFKEALCRINGWKKEFFIDDMNNDENVKHLEKNFYETKKILNNIIIFCKNNGYEPIIVIPPVSKILSEQISNKFMKKVLYDNIRFLKDKQIPILNYWKDNRLNDYKLYINSDFLNEKGSKLFTKIVLEDIKKLDKVQR